MPFAMCLCDRDSAQNMERVCNALALMNLAADGALIVASALHFNFYFSLFIYPSCLVDCVRRVMDAKLECVESHWVSPNPCPHLRLVLSLIQSAAIPTCIDVFAPAKAAYMTGIPEFDPADNEEDAAKRLAADQLERRAYVDEVKQRCFAWPRPSQRSGQELLVAIFDALQLTTSGIDFVLLRGASANPVCLNPNHVLSSAPGGCPAKDAVQVLKRLRDGARYVPLPGEVCSEAEESEESSQIAPPSQSYICRPAFFDSSRGATAAPVELRRESVVYEGLSTTSASAAGSSALHTSRELYLLCRISRNIC